MNNFKIEDTRPFNVDHAKAGAPYAQRNGLAARIGIWDAANRDGQLRLIGALTEDTGAEYMATWDDKGGSLTHAEMSNLVMIPLGYCEGKPVFVGDELYSHLREDLFIVQPVKRAFDKSSWPRTKPVMPVVFHSNSAMQSTFEHIAMYNREILERHWKALDKFNGVKA